MDLSKKLGSKLKAAISSSSSPSSPPAKQKRNKDTTIVVLNGPKDQLEEEEKVPEWTLRTKSEVVYIEYDDVRGIPPKPGTDGSTLQGGFTPAPALSATDLENPDSTSPAPQHQWTRFVCISDTHCRQFDVPDGDVLLHSGDLTNTGLVEEIKETMEWLCSLPHKVKIIIAGNHDLTLHKGWYEINWKRWHGQRRHGQQDTAAVEELVKGEEAKQAGVVYLEDEMYEFSLREGGRVWTVYGSPWSPEFGHWAFNYDRGVEAEELVKQFPICDILLTHGPPHHILDRARNMTDVGCATLRSHLSRLKPRLHLFGHIHEAHGAYIHVWNQHRPKAPSEGTSIGIQGKVVTRRLGTIGPPKVQNRQMTREGEVHDGVAGWPKVEDGKDEMGDLDVNPDFDGLPPVGDDVDADAGTEDEPQGPGSDDDDNSAPTTGSLDNVEQDEEEEWDHTVFVNASNWPMGRGFFSRGPPKQFGGPGFRPIVVDLRDDEGY